MNELGLGAISVPLALPPGWAWAEIGELEPEFQNGASSRGEAAGTPTIVLRLADVINGQISLAKPRRLLLSDRTREKYRAAQGDILVIRVNGSKEITGQFILCNVDNLVYCDHFIRMRIADDVCDPRFLAALGSSSLVRRQIEQSLVSTAGQNTINQSRLRSVVIPVPPRVEQERVVAAIEEQFSRVDSGVAALDRIRQNLKRMRAAVLEAAMLSARGASTVPVPLGDLVMPGRKVAYGVLVPGDDVPDGVPFVRVGDLKDRTINTGSLKRISPSIAARYPRTSLQGGEVLLSVVGTIGRSAVVPPTLAGANTARALAVIPVRGDVDPRYVAIALSRNPVTADLTSLSHEVARKTLNLEDVRKYAIWLPPHEQQLEIVEMVEEAEIYIAAVEGLISRASRHSGHLRSAILASAFSGTLVYQDPSDESALAMLRRIASERALSNGESTIKRTRRIEATG